MAKRFLEYVVHVCARAAGVSAGLLVMTDYRFYFLNSADRIEAAQHEELHSDAEAIAMAHTVLNGYTFTDAIEVWDAKRLVARMTRFTDRASTGTTE